MRMATRFVLAGCLLGLLAADWPQWRGPDRTGISKEKKLLKEWPKAGPKLVWSSNEIGLGYAAPAVVDGKAYFLGTKDKDEVIIALDGMGKQLWSAKLGPIHDFDGNAWSAGPNAAPCVDGELIFALSSKGDLVCVDTAGKEQWRKNLPSEMGGVVSAVGGGDRNLGWGYACAPVIDGDNLIVTPGGSKGLFAALNKKTGAVVWQSKEVPDAATYAAPIVATIGGIKQCITLVQNGAVGVSAKDGTLLWEHRKGDPYPDVVCTTPIAQGNLVYLSIGYGAGSELLELTPADGKFKVNSLYAVKEMGNKQGGVILLDGYVYGFHENRAWTCQDFMTGTVKWESNRRGLGAGSALIADGRLYCLGEDKCQVAMLAATPDGYKELSRFTLPKESMLRKPRGKAWTHPVLSNGLLYLRDQELVYCYKVD